MKRIALVLLILVSIYSNAQPSITWQKCLGGSDVEKGNSIQKTSDGGYILVGETSSDNGDVSGNHGSTDVWLVKLTSLGAIEWQKCLGGSLIELCSSIQQTSDGGYILTGDTQSNNGDVSGNLGNYDAWVVKLTSEGVIEWQKCFGGSLDDAGRSIQQTTDGGYILNGHTGSNFGDVSGIHEDYDAWVVKLTSLGVIQWQKCLGGNSTDYGRNIQQTSDGGYILTGRTLSNDGDVSGNHGNYEAWVVKLSSTLGLEEPSYNNLVKLYPNPVQNVLNLKTENKFINLSYTIIDGLGRIVLNGKLNEVDTTISVEQLSKGIYYLKLTDNSTNKFIKE